MNFNLHMTELHVRRTLQALSVVRSEEHRLNASVAFRAKVAQALYVQPSPACDPCGLETPVIIAAVHGRGWQLKLASMQVNTDRSTKLNVEHAIPLVDCPTDFILRFGKLEILGALVDKVIASELALTRKPEIGPADDALETDLAVNADAATAGDIYQEAS